MSPRTPEDSQWAAVGIIFTLTALPAFPGDAQTPPKPQRLKLGGEIRGRAEGFTGLQFAPDNDDGYYLHRLRLDAAVEAAWRPAPAWLVKLDQHFLWLATSRDALYAASGRPFVRNPSASGGRVGGALDLQGTYRFSPRLQIGFGYAHVFPGPYLKQSAGGSGLTTAYLMWAYTL